MQGRVLQLARSVQTSTRWRGSELTRLTPPVDGPILDLLTEAGGFASLFLRTDPSPWTGADLVDGAAVQRALDLVEQIHSETLPRFLVMICVLARPEATRRGAIRGVHENKNSAGLLRL